MTPGVTCEKMNRYQSDFSQEYEATGPKWFCVGYENRTQIFFRKLFGQPQDIPAKIPGYPAKKFGFPGFRRTYRALNFGPHPFPWKTPTPPKDIRTKKFGSGFLFLP